MGQGEFRLRWEPQSKAGLLGAEGEKAWVCPQLPSSEGPVSSRDGFWALQRAEVDAYLDLLQAAKSPNATHVGWEPGTQ